MPTDSYSRAARRLSPCTLRAARGRSRSRNARIEVRSSARPSPRPRHSGATASCPTQPTPSDSHTSDSDTPTILPSAAAMNHHAGSKLELSIDRTRHGSNSYAMLPSISENAACTSACTSRSSTPSPELPQDHTLREAGRLRITIEVADHPPVAVSHGIAVVRQQAGRRGVAVGDVLATGQAPLQRPRLHQRQQSPPRCRGRSARGGRTRPGRAACTARTRPGRCRPPPPGCPAPGRPRGRPTRRAGRPA